MLRGIISRGHIVDFSIFLCGLTAMRTSFGYIQHTPIVGIQAGSVPVPIGRRRWPEVDDDIEYLAPGAAHQFRLERRRNLVVQAAYCARVRAEPHVGLYRSKCDALLCEFAEAPRAHEPSPRILDGRRLDEPGARNVTLL